MTTNVPNSEPGYISEKIKRFSAGLITAVVELEELTPEETEIALADVEQLFCNLYPNVELHIAFADFLAALGEFYSDEWCSEDD